MTYDYTGSNPIPRTISARYFVAFWLKYEGTQRARYFAGFYSTLFYAALQAATFRKKGKHKSTHA